MAEIKLHVDVKRGWALRLIFWILAKSARREARLRQIITELRASK